MTATIIWIAGISIIISIGVVGCIATLDEIEYRNKQWRDDNES